MDYTLINSDFTCGGLVGTEPNHSNWTLTPYLGGFVKEKWNGIAWIENATPEEIAQATVPTLTVNEVIFDLVTKQVETMTEEEKNDLLTLLNT
jgi:hypothetical protein